MKKFLILALCLLATMASAKEPIELLCNIQSLDCTKKQCEDFEKPRWLFNIKKAFGNETSEKYIVIDENRKFVRISGSWYPTEPENWGKTHSYVRLNMQAKTISMEMVVLSDCVLRKDCVDKMDTYAIKERIEINRENGKILHELVSTHDEGEYTRDKAFIKDFGYCSSNIKREF